MAAWRRRFRDRPRVTIRVVMYFALIVALFNGLSATTARRLHYSGLPIEMTRRQEMVLFISSNALALWMSLWVFYGPYWEGRSRREWMKVLLTQRLPAGLVCWGVGYSFKAITNGTSDKRIPVTILVVILVGGPALGAVILAIKLWRRSSRGPGAPADDR